MRVLEARFHPQQKEHDAFIVVGHVLWPGGDARGRPVVRPAPSLAEQTASDTILTKLQYLVSLTAPESFEGLQALRSHFWSFVDVTGSMAR